MGKIAIIGTGIAGMGVGHLLHPLHELTYFEKNDYIGGHTHTVHAPHPVDTGFIVFNDITYPNLVKLFQKLKVPVKNSNMSFSVAHLPSGLEYCGSGISGLFVQRKNIFNPRYIRMLLSLGKFNEVCVEVLDDPRFTNMSLGEYFKERKFHPDVLEKYLAPMSAAVWSTPPELMLDFPIVTLVRFFKNHGFLGLNTQYQWKTVDGGSIEYLGRLIAPFKERIRVNAPALEVGSEQGMAYVKTSVGKEFFDKVILACHGDEALKLLATPTPLEQNLLGAFKYLLNETILHTDSGLMPKNKKAWSAWNYRIQNDEDSKKSVNVTYYMNQLQGISKEVDYFVSLNSRKWIDPKKILGVYAYEHPFFDLPALSAQKDLPALNRQGHNLYFCGSYFKYGFHEDALSSAVALAQELAPGVAL